MGSRNSTNKQMKPFKKKLDKSAYERDYKLRCEWVVGCKCLIFSASNNKWFIAQIIKIYTDHQGEWITVEYEDREKDIKRFSKQIRPIVTKKDGGYYQRLRDEWKIGSKLLMFSSHMFNQWIFSTITNIEYDNNGKESLFVSNCCIEGANKNNTYSFHRFSHNIQPIICDMHDDDKKQEMDQEPDDLNNSYSENEEKINNNLYLSQFVGKDKENELRVKWKIESKCIIFSKTQKKWFIGKIVKIFVVMIQKESKCDGTYKAETEWICVKYGDNTENIQRFSGYVQPIYIGNNDKMKIDASKIENAFDVDQSEEQLRKKWTVGSKCMVFSRYFKQWILTHIDEIHLLFHYNEQEEQLKIWDGTYLRSMNRFSNDIQPIYAIKKEYETKNEDKDLSEEEINKCLYLSGLHKGIENKLRLKWKMGSKLLINCQEKNKWFLGEIVKIKMNVIEKTEGDHTFEAVTQCLTVQYDDDKTKEFDRFCKDIGAIFTPIWDNDTIKDERKYIEEKKEMRVSMNMDRFNTRASIAVTQKSKPFIKNCQYSLKP